MSLTKVSYSMIAGATANALDFGADPTGVADSTSALQEALNTGKSVYLPKGTYVFSNTLNLSTESQIIFGESTRTTILRKNFIGVGINVTATGAGLFHFQLNSTGLDSADTTAHGIVLNSKRWNLSDVWVTQHGGNGIDAIQGNLSVAEKVRVTDNNNGFVLTGVDTNAITLVGLDAGGNTLDGVVLSGVYGISLLGGYSAANGRFGYNFNASRINASGIGGEQNGTDEVVLGASTVFSHIVIVDGTVITVPPANELAAFNVVINTDSSTSRSGLFFPGGFINNRVGNSAVGFYRTGVIFTVTNNDVPGNNLLDDYQEGTFEPNLIRTTTQGTYTPGASDFGQFTKIGNTVTVRGIFDGTYSGGSGSFRIVLPIPNFGAFSYATVEDETAGTFQTVGNAGITGIGTPSSSLGSFTYVSGNEYRFAITYLTKGE